MEFRCPKCNGKYFGTDLSQIPWIRYCNDQFGSGCRWRGLDEECGLTQYTECKKKDLLKDRNKMTFMHIRNMAFDWDELDNRRGRLHVERDGAVVCLFFVDEHSKKIYLIDQSYQPEVEFPEGITEVPCDTDDPQPLRKTD